MERESFAHVVSRSILVLALLGSSLVLVTPRAHAAVTISVPEDFATISAAITAAASGDTIDIAPGVYSGAVTLNKSVTLRGRFADPNDPRNNTTILEASASQDVITISSGVTPAPIVTGLVLRNGLSGVSLKSPAVIEGNLLVGNNDQLDYKVGGGGFCRGNVFQDAIDDGIDINHPVRDLTIENNVMTNSHGDGVEMRLNDDTIAATAHIAFRNNQITGSRSDGIQIIDYYTDTNRVISIERNLIRDNGRAGIGLLDGGTTIEDYRAASIRERITVFHNTLVRNNHGISGGDNLIALNNILVGHFLGMKNVDGDSVASHNLFWGNTTDASGSIVQASIVADPRLDADYGLQASSPAIDAGVAHFEWNGEVIMDQPSGAYQGSAPDLGWKEASSGSGGGKPPTMTSVGITPSSPGTNALLTANATASDPEGDQISFSYQWIKNDVNLAGATAKTLDLSVAGNGDKGDRLAVTVIASDGSGNSSPMTSSAATVANTNPTFDQNLSDRSDAEGDAISFSASASDPDGDPLTYGATGLPPGLTIDAGSGLISGSIASGAAGSYAVEVTVGDGATVDGSDTFTWVVAAAGSTIVRRPVAASNDDAEESAAGAVNLNSVDLELVADGARGNQTVGMRFTGVAVPKNAVIIDAYVQFQVDRATSVATSLTVQGQAADNPATFSTASLNLSSRPRTSHSVMWGPVPAWPTAGAAGPDQRTPDLSSVVQEVVNRPGWANGNPMVIIITGSGKRVAESFDGGAPPILYIEYGASPQNLAPVADAGPDQQVTLPNIATMAGSATDDGFPTPPGAITKTWSQVSGPPTMIFADPHSLTTTVSFFEAGTYVLRLTADDGALQASDDVTVTVNGGSSTNLVGNPGFEESTNGWNVSGSDAGVTLTRVGVGHSGGWAGRLSNEGTAPGMCKLNDQPNWVATTGTGVYGVGMWARADAPGATLTIRIREYAGNVLVDKQTTSLGLSTSWQQVTLSYVTRSPGSTLDLQAWVPAAPVGTCFYADDVAITTG